MRADMCMDPLSLLPPLTSVIARHGLSTRKALGQHFLLDEAITRRIVHYADGVENHHIIEIGPGPGGLTRALLAAGAGRITAIEMDERCLAILQELKAASGGRLEVMHADALGVDLIAATPGPRKIVANLPYNAGTQMLIQWLEAIHAHGPSAFASMTLMFQKEVAERIAAAPGGKEYGRLSVFAQWLCEVRLDMELPAAAFTPPPKVDSMVVTLTPRKKPLVDVPKDALEKVLAAAFGQRRKMLRGSLKSLGVDTEKWLLQAGIEGNLRAERLSVEEFCRLAQELVQLRHVS